ncbi:MAG: hypothetical protein NC120_07265 [Ruminococcus sp.]|nr:hypothetical protein [Ruminococcus sp.]
MKMIPVNDIPCIRRRHDLADFLKEFADGGDTTVKVDFTEYDYISAKVCYLCLHNAAKRHGYNIKVMIRENEVFLTKR